MSTVNPKACPTDSCEDCPLCEVEISYYGTRQPICRNTALNRNKEMQNK
jgi:hypothetical protein